MKERTRKIAKILLAFTMILIMFFAFDNNTSFAADDELSLQSLLDRGANFIQNGKDQSTLEEGELISEFLPIGRVLVAIGTATVFIVMAILGVKWITATPDQQANLKKQLVGLVVAIVVIYGAVGIWTLVRTIMENLTAA